jgi:hypothetical protein
MRIVTILASCALLLRKRALLFAAALFFLPACALAQVSVTVSPSAVNLTPGATQQFAAVVTGSSNTAVTWSVQEASGGTINASGLYTAPLGLGEYHVVATSQADTAISSTAVVALPGFVTYGLNNAHNQGTATLLQGGKILYAGGISSNGCASSNAEVYDPVTDLSTNTPAMVVARCAQTATLLPNGQVLLAGRQTAGGGGTATAELYDPVAGTFTATGNMHLARSGHTATLLSNGTVLIAGGSTCTSSCVPASEAEIYNPGTGTFTVTGSMSVPRNGAYSSALPSGGALIAGGNDCSSSCVVYTSAEIYNAETGTFSLTGSMVAASQLGAAVTLANGNVLILDGDVAGVISSTAEIYTPSTGQFTSTGSLNVARSSETLTLLQDGTVLVAGGNGSQTLANPAEIYNPTSGTFSLSGPLLQPSLSCLTTLAPSGQVVVVAGGTDTQFYNPATKTFTSHSSYLNVVRFDHTATTLQDGRVLLAGGLTIGQGAVTGTAEIYDPATGLSTLTGSMSSARAYHTATLLPDGTVLIIGGFSNAALTTIVPTAEIFNPSTGTFSLTATSPNTPRAQHTATLLQSGEVLILGGQSLNASSPGLTSAELYDRVAGTFSLAGNMTFQRFGHTATLLNDGDVLILGGIPALPGFTPPPSAPAAELYDPSTGVFTALTSATNSFYFPGPNGPGFPFDSTLLPSGDVLASVDFIYDLMANAFSAIPNTGATFQGYKFSNTPNGQVLVVGGGISQAELFDPATEIYSPPFTEPVERTSPTANLLSNGQVLVAGGSDFSLTRVDFYQPAVAVPAPILASVSPNPVTGFSPVTITVQGANFAPGAVVADDFVGSNLQTTFVSDIELTAVFPQSSLLLPGNHTIFVQNIQDARFASTTLNVVNPQMVSSGGSGVTIGFLGNVTLGTSATQSITFTNQGNATLTLDSFGVSGTNMADFTIMASGTTCPLQGGSLAALASCAVDIQFTPPAVGSFSAQLTASYQTPTSPIVIPLSGTGAGVPAATVSPSSLTFGNQDVGTSSAPQQVTISSTGTAALVISNIQVTTGFQMTNTCPSSLAPNTQCAASIVFAPTLSGPNGGTLGITANDSVNPHVVPLSGTGIGVSTSAIAPTSLTFASQAVGSSSAAQQVIIASIGTGNLQISSITLTDTTDFKQTNNCPASLGPNSNCSASVTFAPSTTGNITGSLVVSANDSSPHNISLSGTGTNFSIAPATGSSSSSTVTAGQPATYQMGLSPQGFSGTVNLSCTEPTSIPYTRCMVSPTQANLNGSSSVSVTVSVSTMAQGGLALPIRRPRFPHPGVHEFATIRWLAFIVATFALLAASRRARRRVPLGISAVLLLALLATGCGSSGSYGGGGGTGGTTGTPAGSYQLLVSASSSGVTRTMTLTLIVQQ